MPSLHSTTPCVFSPFLQRSLFAPAAAFQSARLKRSVGCGAFRLQSLLLSAEAAHRALPGFHSCVLASAVHDDALYPRHHGPGALPHPGDRIPKADCFSGSVCCVSSCVLIFVGFCVCLFALVRHIPIGSVGSANAHRCAQVYSMATSHTLDNPFVPIYSLFIAIW